MEAATHTEQQTENWTYTKIPFYFGTAALVVGVVAAKFIMSNDPEIIVGNDCEITDANIDVLSKIYNDQCNQKIEIHKTYWDAEKIKLLSKVTYVQIQLDICMENAGEVTDSTPAA